MKMIYNLVSNADRKASSTAEVRVHPNSDIALSASAYFTIIFPIFAVELLNHNGLKYC